MIRHAWTVICNRLVVDKESNNLSLDVLEQIEIELGAPAPDAKVKLFPIELRIVSLWYRDGAVAEGASAYADFVDPNGQPLGRFEFTIELEKERHRTIGQLPAVPYTVDGTYRVIVRLRAGDELMEVAQVPLAIALRIVPVAKPLAGS